MKTRLVYLIAAVITGCVAGNLMLPTVEEPGLVESVFAAGVLGESITVIVHERNGFSGRKRLVMLQSADGKEWRQAPRVFQISGTLDLAEFVKNGQILHGVPVPDSLGETPLSILVFETTVGAVEGATAPGSALDTKIVYGTVIQPAAAITFFPRVAFTFSIPGHRAPSLAVFGHDLFLFSINEQFSELQVHRIYRRLGSFQTEGVNINLASTNEGRERFDTVDKIQVFCITSNTCILIGNIIGSRSNSSFYHIISYSSHSQPFFLSRRYTLDHGHDGTDHLFVAMTPEALAVVGVAGQRKSTADLVAAPPSLTTLKRVNWEMLPILRIYPPTFDERSTDVSGPFPVNPFSAGTPAPPNICGYRMRFALPESTEGIDLAKVPYVLTVNIRDQVAPANPELNPTTFMNLSYDIRIETESGAESVILRYTGARYPDGSTGGTAQSELERVIHPTIAIDRTTAMRQHASDVTVATEDLVRTTTLNHAPWELFYGHDGKIEILVDQNTLEIYIDDGRVILTENYHTQSGNLLTHLCFTSTRSIVVSSIRAASVYPQNSSVDPPGIIPRESIQSAEFPLFSSS